MFLSTLLFCKCSKTTGKTIVHNTNGVLFYQTAESWNETNSIQPVFQVFPEGNTMKATRFFQAGKCVAALPSCFATSPTADFSPFDVFPYLTFAQIIVQRESRVVQYL